MIEVELVGEAKGTDEVYVSEAQSPATFESDEQALSTIHYLAEGCVQQWVENVDEAGEALSITVTLSPHAEDVVSSDLEGKLQDGYNANDVSLQFEEVPKQV